MYHQFARTLIQSNISVRQTLCGQCHSRRNFISRITCSIQQSHFTLLEFSPGDHKSIKGAVQKKMSYKMPSSWKDNKNIHSTVEQLCKFTEENIKDWIHPDSRKESELLQDPELKGLLRELVSDFEEGVPGQEQGEDVAVRFEGSTVVTKEAQVKDVSTKESDVAPKTRKKMLLPVFDVDSITDLLHEENAEDMCVISVPPERQYVDYFIIVTVRSSRHLRSMTEAVNKSYKNVKSSKHPFVLVEGKESDDWMCIDFGNIVVHFMTSEVRELYELEKLWLLGPEHDEHMRRMKQYQETLRQALVDETSGEEEQGAEKKE